MSDAPAPEEWRPTPEAPGYEASSRGRIRGAAGPLRLQANPDGYLMVTVVIDGKKTTRQVGACVCAAFHGPRPEDHEADHRNRQRAENIPSNLRWLPSQVNRSLAAHKTGEDRHGAKLTAATVAEIRAAHVPFSRTNGSRALGKKYGVSRTVVDKIIQGASWAPKSRAEQTREVVDA